MGVYHGFENSEPQICFFLKKPSLVGLCFCYISKLKKYAITDMQNVFLRYMLCFKGTHTFSKKIEIRPGTKE